MTDTQNDSLELLIDLFQSGKELSRQYAEYDGGKDWVEWLKEVLPKTGILERLEQFGYEREIEALKWVVLESEAGHKGVYLQTAKTSGKQNSTVHDRIESLERLKKGEV